MPSQGVKLTIDTTPPVAPSAPGLLATDDSGTKGDGITNVTQPHFTGTAEAGATVQLINSANVVVATTTAASNGSYSLQPPAALANGSYSFRTRAIDAAGNVGPFSAASAVTILLAAPAVPSNPALAAASDTGVAGDGKTSVRRPILTGKAASGTFVDLLDSQGDVLGTATVTATGTYSIQPAANLTTGAIALRVRDRDVAGNVGAASGALTLTIVDATNGDFDGDGKTDFVVFRVATSQWIGTYSGTNTAFVAQFGDTSQGDIPVPADYDGVGHSQFAVFRPSTGQWIINGAGGTRIVQFGDPSQGDIPVPADYDGVGHAELAVFRPSTDQWIIDGPSGLHIVQFGDPKAGDIPVPADYDGIGHAEFAVFRPSTGQWLVASTTGLKITTFGNPNLTDVPIPGDYDGVGHAEFAVYRPATSQWIIDGRTLRVVVFGTPKLVDVPVEAPLDNLEKAGKIAGVHLAALTAEAQPPATAKPAAVSSASSATTIQKAKQAAIDAALESLIADGLATRARLILSDGSELDPID